MWAGSCLSCLRYLKRFWINFQTHPVCECRFIGGLVLDTHRGQGWRGEGETDFEYSSSSPRVCWISVSPQIGFVYLGLPIDLKYSGVDGKLMQISIRGLIHSKSFGFLTRDSTYLATASSADKNIVIPRPPLTLTVSQFGDKILYTEVAYDVVGSHYRKVELYKLGSCSCSGQD